MSSDTDWLVLAVLLAYPLPVRHFKRHTVIRFF